MEWFIHALCPEDLSLVEVIIGSESEASFSADDCWTDVSGWQDENGNVVLEDGRLAAGKGKGGGKKSKPKKQKKPKAKKKKKPKKKKNKPKKKKNKKKKKRKGKKRGKGGKKAKKGKGKKGKKGRKGKGGKKAGKDAKKQKAADKKAKKDAKDKAKKDKKGEKGQKDKDKPDGKGKKGEKDDKKKEKDDSSSGGGREDSSSDGQERSQRGGIFGRRADSQIERSLKFPALPVFFSRRERYRETSSESSETYENVPQDSQVTDDKRTAGDLGSESAVAPKKPSSTSESSSSSSSSSTSSDLGDEADGKALLKDTVITMEESIKQVEKKPGFINSIFCCCKVGYFYELAGDKVLITSKWGIYPNHIVLLATLSSMLTQLICCGIQIYNSQKQMAANAVQSTSTPATGLPSLYTNPTQVQNKNNLGTSLIILMTAWIVLDDLIILISAGRLLRRMLILVGVGCRILPLLLAITAAIWMHYGTLFANCMYSTIATSLFVVASVILTNFRHHPDSWIDFDEKMTSPWYLRMPKCYFCRQGSRWSRMCPCL